MTKSFTESAENEIQALEDDQLDAVVGGWGGCNKRWGGGGHQQGGSHHGGNKYGGHQQGGNHQGGRQQAKPQPQNPQPQQNLLTFEGVFR